MPEIKNTFTQGKMNKDLDERIVPNGQYRDAMNIQISTSEASDVGTVQNILGNLDVFKFNPYYGPSGPDPAVGTDNGNQIDPTAKCIGAISDEKNDCFYWFIYSGTKSVILKYQTNQISFVFVDTTNNVLEFSNNLITAINIIDDYLFWTDGQNEPKKINVQLTKTGTHQGGHYNTRLIIPKRGIAYASDFEITKEYITVIKPSPKSKLIVDPQYNTVVSATIDMEINAEQGDTIAMSFENFLPSSSSFKYGDIVRILESASTQSIINEQQLRVEILDDVNGNIDPLGGFYPNNTYKVKILSKSVLTPTTQTTYNCRKEISGLIFPRKFIRFGYRYRYNSGEYSTFSPFTDPVFKPGTFKYNPRNAYNTAMENTLISIKLRNFTPKDIPLDVVQIDILYTESDSPVVYIVDKIKYFDDASVYINTGATIADRILVNNWTANLYEVTADLIYAAVPENQLLRLYDNVPITALAQEVTGSRIVYGNYKQNYNIDTKPVLLGDFISRYTNNTYYENTYEGNDSNGAITPIEKKVVAGDGQKSLKTMRDYQLGLSYLDGYGRQTPIFTSNESQFKIPKKHAANKLKISGKVITNAPSWAKSFKVHVKETSTEYYNLALSRVYEASDGDLWLSFPSSERNKVDEETFLILKKPADSNSLVSEEAKYKVLAIENEAPDYIKTVVTPVVKLSCGAEAAGNDADSLFASSAPTPGSRYFQIDWDDYQAAAGPDLNDIEGSLHIRFFHDIQTGNDNYSKILEVKAVGGGTDSQNPYTITLKNTIDGSDASFLYLNYPTTDDANSFSGLPGTLNIKSKMKLIIYNSVKENLPEFNGVFFVKINADPVAQAKIIPSINASSEYEVLTTLHSFYFSDFLATTPVPATTTTINTSTDSFDDHTGETSSSYNVTNSKEEWIALLKFGTNTSGSFIDNIHAPTLANATGGFFIDKAHYAGIHPEGSIESTENENDNFLSSNNPNHVYRSSWYPGSGIFSGYNPSEDDPQSFGVDANGDLDPSILKFGKGVYQDTDGNWFMEISFSKAGVHARTDDHTRIGFKDIYLDINYWDCNRAYIWEPENNTDTVTQFDDIYDTSLVEMINKISTGSMFQFKNDDTDTIFSILDVKKIKRYNYVNWRQVMIAWRNMYDQFSTVMDADDAWDSDLEGFKTTYMRFAAAHNRRITYRLSLGKQNIDDVRINVAGVQTEILEATDAITPIGIEFVETKIPDYNPVALSENPAIFETEPKKTADLDIYYEATEALPLVVNNKNIETFIPKGSVITCPDRLDVVHPTETDYVIDTNGILISCKYGIDIPSLMGLPVSFLPPVPIYFTRLDDSYTSAYVNTALSMLHQSNGTIQSNQFYIQANVSKNPFSLSWFNCFSFNNGVESNRIRDDFNQVILDKGVKVSSTIDSVYEEEIRSGGLIYSGIYNSNNGVNNLNQFIQAENITKDLNPTYGSIQKLFQRELDLVAFCEDRVVGILANKDTLFNADGNANIIASTKVLGNANPFAGDYGISKNPESFAKDNYRAYFTDKQRGVVLRLSKDGLTPISEYGMSGYFKDTLKNNLIILGSYDNKKEEYNITMPFFNTTVSYKENVKGWPSFKSFIPEQALSLSGNYFTFLNGVPHAHHDESVNRNTFYGIHAPSSIDVLLNENPGVIKSFKTLKYEGTQSRVNQEVSRVETGYYNLEYKPGWYSDLIQTDKDTNNSQHGNVLEFIEKEGKWFNYIKGDEDNRKTDEFSFQGIGNASTITVDLTLFPAEYGCTSTNATNFLSTATVDDGSCIFPSIPTLSIIPGCMDPNATNYDITATFDDGSCTLPVITPPVFGCTDSTAYNYDSSANTDDGSCVPYIYGCTDINASNFDPLANTDDGSCVYLGCTDPQAINYDPYAIVDDGSCIYNPIPVPGCMDPLATNYNPLATVDDGSCLYAPTPIPGCMDPNATNYDPLATVDDGSCLYGPTTPFRFKDDNDDDN